MRSNGIAEYTFAGGVMRWTAGTRFAEFDCNKLSIYADGDAFDRSVVVNGVKQKVADSAANATDKILAMQETCQNLSQRIWNGPRVTILELALRAAYPDKSEESIRKWLAGKDSKFRGALERIPAVAEELAKLRKPAAVDDAAIAKMEAELDQI